MLRSAPRLLAVFLCGAALCGCATLGSKDATADKTADKTAASPNKNLPTDIDSGVAQAQTARLTGRYDDAIHILSQLMLVAADDPRVVAEYGKTLVGQGRGQEASEFLNRAIELSSNDWTLYSAMGVADDQLGNQVAARVAYEHALAIKPNEPSVLNNYALSRMLANDADGARILMARAQAAGGAGDAKIAANIAMIAKLAPAKPEAVAAIPKAPASSAPVAQSAPQPAPKPIATASLPAAAKPVQNAPRPIMPQPVQQAPVQAAPSGVVMQAVPIDPLAGPVKLIKPKPKAVAKTDAQPKTADALTPPVIIIDPKSVKPKAQPAQAKDAIPALRLTADARNP